MRLRLLASLLTLAACSGTTNSPGPGAGGALATGGASGGSPSITRGGSGGSGACLPFQSLRDGRCTPEFAGAVALGGSMRDLAMAPDGSFYVVGLFDAATDFDPGAGVDMQTPAGGLDSFVTHFAADGSYL